MSCFFFQERQEINACDTKYQIYENKIKMFNLTELFGSLSGSGVGW